MAHIANANDFASPGVPPEFCDCAPPGGWRPRCRSGRRRRQIQEPEPHCWAKNPWLPNSPANSPAGALRRSWSRIGPQPTASHYPAWFDVHGVEFAHQTYGVTDDATCLALFVMAARRRHVGATCALARADQDAGMASVSGILPGFPTGSD